MVNEWTRDDLPRIGTPNPAHDPVVEGALDTVVHWLNKHYPKPSGSFAVMLEGTHRAQRERDVALRKKGEAFDRAVRAERERDEWKASADKWHGEWQKIAPARTVTREDIEKAVRRYIPNPHFSEPIADEVCALFGVEAEPADPVLDKAQEFATLVDWEMSDREANLLLLVARHVLGQEENP